MSELAVLYARVSTKDQEAGYSPEAQVRLLREYAERCGLKIVHEFIEAESARGTGRKKFFEMLEFIEQEGIRTVLCEKIDRFTRNDRDSLVIDDLNLEVHFVKENQIMTKDSESYKKLLFDILKAAAKFQSNRIGEEAKKGMLEKARQGGYPGLAPLGYLNVAAVIDDKKRAIAIDPKKAPLVKEAFELYATGDYSLVALKDELNHKGFRNHNNGRITKHGLQVVLDNPFYYGEFKWSREKWKGNHEPIISKELFDKVQSVLHVNSNNTKRNSHKWFAFKGILKCGFCGCSITAETKKGHNYYRCTFGRGRCQQRYYREEVIDEMFRDALGEFYLDDEISAWILEMLKKSHVEQDASIKRGLKRLHSEETRKNNQLAILYEDRLNGDISIEFYRQKKAEIQNEVYRIRSEIEKLNRCNFNFKDEGVLLLELLRGIQTAYEKATLMQKNKILKILLNKCELRGEGSTFQWKEPFDILFRLGKVLRTKERGE